jgi:hypothetical protein
MTTEPVSPLWRACPSPPARLGSVEVRQIWGFTPPQLRWRPVWPTNVTAPSRIPDPTRSFPVTETTAVALAAFVPQGLPPVLRIPAVPREVIHEEGDRQ